MRCLGEGGVRSAMRAEKSACRWFDFATATKAFSDKVRLELSEFEGPKRIKSSGLFHGRQRATSSAHSRSVAQ
jgi:hypothetical protein